MLPWGVSAAVEASIGRREEGWEPGEEAWRGVQRTKGRESQARVD